MEFDIPEGLRYTESHEWTEERGGVVRIGITDFAQDELGDIVFIDVPGEGERLEQGEEFAVVESIKAVSDLYTPVSGTVVATNDVIQEQPELVNKAPYDDGWFIELDPSGGIEHLLNPDEYRELL